MERINSQFGITKQSGFYIHHPLIYSLVYGLEAKNVLEVGAGMSTKALVSAAEDLTARGNHCKVFSFDQREIENTGLEKDFEANKARNFSYTRGTTSDTLKDLDITFDFCLHDGTHDYVEIKEDLKMILPKMKHGSFLCIHDVDFSSDNVDIRLFSRAVLDTMNYYGQPDPLLLPYGYGLAIYHITGNFHNGKVEPKWKKGLKI